MKERERERDSRVRRWAEERILTERLKREAAEELREAGVGGVVLGAIVDIHGENEHDHIHDHDEGDDK